MDICQSVFGKPHKQLTAEEQRRFQQLKRKVNYYRWHKLNCRSQRESKRERKHRLLEALGWLPQCQRCGYDRYLGALDFHHTDPQQKDDNVLTFGWTRALEEARKCQLICSNCHRELHSEDETRYSTGRPRTTDPLLETYMRAAGLSEEKILAALSGR